MGQKRNKKSENRINKVEEFEYKSPEDYQENEVVSFDLEDEENLEENKTIEEARVEDSSVYEDQNEEYMCKFF